MVGHGQAPSKDGDGTGSKVHRFRRAVPRIRKYLGNCQLGGDRSRKSVPVDAHAPVRLAVGEVWLGTRQRGCHVSGYRFLLRPDGTRVGARRRPDARRSASRAITFVHCRRHSCGDHCCGVRHTWRSSGPLARWAARRSSCCVTPEPSTCGSATSCIPSSTSHPRGSLPAHPQTPKWLAPPQFTMPNAVHWWVFRVRQPRSPHQLVRTNRDGGLR